MNDAHVTLVGWIAQDPFYTVTQNGNPFLSLRVGCTPRRFDRQLGQWQDLEPMFVTVNCWRGLAENVNSSELTRGDPVLVTGRLRIRQYVRDGQLRFSAEVEAITLGHDLTQGSAQFRRAQRGGAMTAADRQEAERLNDRWAEGGAQDPATGDAGDEETTAPVVIAAPEGYPGGGGHGDDEEDGAELDPYEVRTAAA
jgi:single-strand DNA-binding protein